ncbi:TPA: hypothetical protein CPT92_07760 [Candidatus Gastranaerophilales bacterium HUM_13]|jgi:hypothetical protein|nr:MAG TPA: hypothetical protein CPT92_07760 [Candidatus Gastranaerophilales bacterium HUM_13]
MNNVSFCGGETAGSIGKRNINPSRMDRIKIQTPQTDTVNFRGRDDDDSSAGSTLASIAVLGALIAGGLGYAHKSGFIAKIKNQNIKKYVEKVAEPCYKACAAVKDFGINCYDKVKGFFKK